MPGMLQPKRELERVSPAELKLTIWPVTGGQPSTRTLPITEDQWNAWQGGTNIERAMPHLNAETREWLMSGLDQAAWDKLFPPEDE